MTDQPDPAAQILTAVETALGDELTDDARSVALDGIRRILAAAAPEQHRPDNPDDTAPEDLGKRNALAQREEAVKDARAFLARAEQAEAAIARVREYVEHSDDDGIRTRQGILRILDRTPANTGHRPGDTDPATLAAPAAITDETNRTEPRRL